MSKGCGHSFMLSANDAIEPAPPPPVWKRRRRSARGLSRSASEVYKETQSTSKHQQAVKNRSTSLCNSQLAHWKCSYSLVYTPAEFELFWGWRLDEDSRIGKSTWLDVSDPSPWVTI